MFLVRRDVHGDFLTHVCPQHGAFWLGLDGKLHEEHFGHDWKRS